MIAGASEEPAEYAIELADADWRTLAPWFLDFEHAAYSFMTPEAFRYFLPAALLHALVGGSNVDAEFHLVDCVQRATSYQAAAIARATLFTREERAAIAAFLRRFPSDENERAIRDHYS